MVIFILVPVRPSSDSDLRLRVFVLVTERKSWEDESGFFQQ